MDDRKWGDLSEGEFDALLGAGLQDLPPEEVVEEVTPLEKGHEPGAGWDGTLHRHTEFLASGYDPARHWGGAYAAGLPQPAV